MIKNINVKECSECRCWYVAGRGREGKCGSCNDSVFVSAEFTVELLDPFKKAVTKMFRVRANSTEDAKVVAQNVFDQKMDSGYEIHDIYCK